MSDISFVYVSGILDRAMGQSKKKVVARRHLVCDNCASWVHYETSGCETKWVDTRADGFVFTCKGCTEVAVLVKEVSGLKQMMEDMKETVAGLQLEDKGAETGSKVTTTGVSQDSEETAENSRTEDTDTGIEGEGRTEDRTEICAGTQLMATHAYMKNQECPVGKEIDLRQWDTLIYKGQHAENEHWRLVEDRHGQVGYNRIRTSSVPGGHPRHDSRKETLPRRDKGTVQRITGLEDGLDRRENEGRAIQRL